jgi:hypothetical protein
MMLSDDEFIRRFLLHALPDPFQRTRYFGFLANRYRTEKLTLCRRHHAGAAAAGRPRSPQGLQRSL